MFRNIASKMAVKSLGDIPIISELYSNPESGLARTAKALGDVAQTQPNHSINSRIGYVYGDITSLRLDAIVNAANTSLLGGGGVDGAIHRAAGPKLLAECRLLRGCALGKAKMTKGYNLPASNVIHTVGPRYGTDGNEEMHLASCYAESLTLAAKSGVKTIAFSAISSGIYGYPSDEAALVACRTVREFMESEDGDEMVRVVFVAFEDKDIRSYNKMLPQFFPPDQEK